MAERETRRERELAADAGPGRALRPGSSQARWPSRSRHDAGGPSRSTELALRRLGRIEPAGALELQRLVGNAATTGLVRSTAFLESPAALIGSVVRSGGGRPLPRGARQKMEATLGADLSTVRLHTGREAARSAQAVGADAYTVGNDIVLADHHDPGSSKGSHILAHEVAHVLQQRSGRVGGEDISGGLRVSQPGDRFEQEADKVATAVRGGQSHREASGRSTISAERLGRLELAAPVSSAPIGAPLAVQRHSSDEHYFLGSLTPAQVEAIAKGRQVAESRKGSKAGSKMAKIMQARGLSPDELKIVADANHVIDNQLVALQRWRTEGGPAPSTVKPGDTSYNEKWGGQLVLVECKYGKKVPATIGDVNALPDFVGSIDDVRNMDEMVVRGILQTIRRTAYISLQNLKADMEGRKHTEKSKERERAGKGQGTWVGAESTTVDLHRKGLLNIPAFFNIGETDKLTAGKKTGGQGAPKGATYEPTLARNACHFPPESWLRWKEYHERARQVINSCTQVEELGNAVNEALVISAFGEHYLQDSFAAGHLINKGFIMALCLENTSFLTKWKRGIKPEHIQQFKTATAHEEAYQAPQLAKKGLSLGNQGQLARTQLSKLKARDPQSALDESRKHLNQDKTLQGMKEVEAAGMDPQVVSLQQYRTWLNDAWYQKITNTMHDTFCVQGLEVSSPAKGGALFKIYGDNSMLRSAEGAKEAALTSSMSIQAINQLAAYRRWMLTPKESRPSGAPPTPPKFATEAIMAHFPDTVAWNNSKYSLKEWATGNPVRQLVDEAMSKFVNKGVIRPFSTMKPFTAGLKHTPF